jgi:hypothetical protein
MKIITGKLMIYLLLLSQLPVKATAHNGVGPARNDFSETDFGRVTVGKPKIWKFDRIYSTLDGLLRDIDAVQIASLTGLDANQSNQATLDFLDTSFNFRAGFNQKAATVNALELERVNAIRELELQGLKAFHERRLQAQQRNIEIDRKLAEARDRRANLDPNSPNVEKERKIETDKITDLTEEESRNLTIINQSPPSLTAVDKTQLEEAGGIQPTPRPTPLISASDLKDSLKTMLTSNAPSLPATKQLDNFITLLHERLSRQLSLSFDDNGRNKDLYLVQFDIGVYPYKDAENHVLRVEFDIKTDGNTTPALAYDLYPTTSSYNITEYWGKSRGTGIAASAAFLFGFGIGAEYKRQRDQVRSALTQNVYMSGFGAGTSRFGWYIGSAPFDKLISPGTRTAYAVIALDSEGVEEVTFTPSVKWSHRSKGSDCDPEILPDIPVELDNTKLAITRFAYQTQYSVKDQRPKENESEQGKSEEFATVQITFNETIDPNLVITVNGGLLPRLRDQRGRATSEQPASTNGNNRGPKGSMFGLLETDSDERSHWFALGSRSISLKLAKSIVGSETFPRIRFLSAATKGDVDFRKLFDNHRLQVRGKKSAGCEWDIFINDFNFNSRSLKCQTPPQAAFVPLFSAVDYVKGSYAWLSGKEIKIVYKNSLPSGYAQIDERTQVVLIDKSDKTHVPLDCSGFGELTCQVPQDIIDVKDYQISIERPEGVGSKGVADKIDLKESPPEKDPKLIGDFNVSQLKGSAGEIRGWYISLPAENLESADQIKGFGELLGPGVAHPTFDSLPKLALGDDANYQVIESKIEIWIPFKHLNTLLQSRLNLERSGDHKFDLPDIAKRIIPSVSDIKKNNGYVAIEGTNLGLVEKVIINGCGDQCSNLRTGASDGLITFAEPVNVTGVFPIQLRLKGGKIEIDAAKTTGESWSLVLTAPAAKPNVSLLEYEARPLARPSSSQKSNTGVVTPYLLSPPPPQPALAPKEKEREIRRKENKVP